MPTDDQLITKQLLYQAPNRGGRPPTSPATRRRRQRAFLAAFAQLGLVSRAAAVARIARARHYAWLRDDPAYAAAFASASDAAADALEAAMIERGLVGWQEAIHQEGQLCGWRHRFSDALLILALKARRPAKFAWRAPRQRPDAAPIVIYQSDPADLVWPRVASPTAP